MVDGAETAVHRNDARVATARRLRRDQTDPERLLWSRLRNKQIGGRKFRRQVPIGRYIADFCCPEAKLVIELDGGGHSADDARRRDDRRTSDIEAAGYLLIRFWNDEVRRNLDGVCETILAQMEGRS
jgi:very-short-patch-repair endonuclease